MMHHDLSTQKKQLEQILAAILAEAKKLGATHAEASVSLGKGFTTNVRMGTVDTLEYLRDKSLSIGVYFGKARGQASTTDTAEASWRETLEAACRIAKYTQEDECSGLADKNRLSLSYPDLKLFSPWEITPEQAIASAIQCESVALTYDKRINNSEGVSVATYENAYAYANSHGFYGFIPTTRHSVSCVMIAKDQGDMQRDYYFSTARQAANLESYELIAKTAAQRTLARLDPQPIKTCEVPVIFSNELARGFIGAFISAISGGNLYRKTSFLCDKIGSQVFPNFINIFEDPYIEGALGSSPFDGEGVKTEKNVFIENGMLKSYVLGSYSARKLGLQTTGNADGIHNLQISTTHKDLPALLKTMDKGLYITELMGQGIRLVTGDYSRGAAGFWVENGEIAYPVAEFTIASNLADMFRGVVGVGGDIDRRGAIQSGSILVDRMMIAGK